MSLRIGIEVGGTTSDIGALTHGFPRETSVAVDVEDVPLAYLPGNATRIRVKAVGDLALVPRA